MRVFEESASQLNPTCKGVTDAVLNCSDAKINPIGSGNLTSTRNQQRTDSTHFLAAVRCLQRLESAGEIVRAALNVLNAANPNWVRSIAQPEWFERYGHRVEDYRLPKGKAVREAYGRRVAADRFAILDALQPEEAPEDLPVYCDEV